MVIATQNPIEQAGTYRLPEAQLDRFLMKTSHRLPRRTTSAIELLAQAANRDRAAQVNPVITADAVAQMSNFADEVHVDGRHSRLRQPSSRRSPGGMAEVKLGLSVRGCLAYVRVRQDLGRLQGPYFVIPDDVKDLAVPVLSHRLILNAEAQFSGVTVEQVIDDLLGNVAAPADRRVCDP